MPAGGAGGAGLVGGDWCTSGDLVPELRKASMPFIAGVLDSVTSAWPSVFKIFISSTPGGAGLATCPIGGTAVIGAMPRPFPHLLTTGEASIDATEQSSAAATGLCGSIAVSVTAITAAS